MVLVVNIIVEFVIAAQQMMFKLLAKDKFAVFGSRYGTLAVFGFYY